MDLDGFLRLSDAQRANATAQAAIANSLADVQGKLAGADSTLADIPDKLAKADLTEAQAVHQQLNNLAEFIGIQWDRQAHEHLIRSRDMALQRVRTLRREEEKLQSALREVSRLMSGEGSWTAIRDGWLGFEYLRGHLDFGVGLKAGTVTPEEVAYEQAAWLHPLHSVPAATTKRDGGSLMHWARTNTLYPVLGGPAWNYLAKFLEGLSTAARELAATMQARTEAAEKAALSLEQQDWDRLKKPQEAHG